LRSVTKCRAAEFHWDEWMRAKAYNSGVEKAICIASERRDHGKGQ
jgi:hypothetical protein